MKRILSLLLLPFLAHGTGMVCQENPRSVRIEIEIADQKLQLRVWSPLGYKYLPQFEGPVSASQLPWMKYQTEQLSVLGDNFKVTWPLESCQYQIGPSTKATWVECQGHPESSVPGVNFYVLSLSHLNESSFAGEMSTRRFRTTVSREGEYGSDFFFVSMAVANSFCKNYE